MRLNLEARVETVAPTDRLLRVSAKIMTPLSTETPPRHERAQKLAIRRPRRGRSQVVT
jgi:hypothetical protein